MEKIFSEMTNKEKLSYRKKLMENNESYCVGVLCKGKIKPLTEFHKKNNRNCIQCVKHREKKLYEKNGSSSWREKTRLKQNQKCVECDKQVTEETLCCFDFDHLDQSIKTCALASLRLASKQVDKEIEAELKKCQLLCCYCHKRKTMKQLNYQDISKEAFAKYEHMKIKEKQIHICPICNKNKMDRQSSACLDCYNIKQRKVTRPSFETLETEVAEFGFVKTGIKYGVTDQAVRKWLKNYIKYENKQLTKIKMKI